MKRPNILLVVLDATRADACSCYDCKWPVTPNLDDLAAEGVLFEQAISPAPWTLPAMASMFTGFFPSQLGVYEQRRLPNRFPTLSQILSENGYATFGITSNSWLSADFGLQRGFDTMHKQWQWLQTSQEINKLALMEKSENESWMQTVIRELSRGNPLKNLLNAAHARFLAFRRDLGASRVISPLSHWVQEQAGPWFALVHYLEAHLPYRPPLEWVARFDQDLAEARRWCEADQLRAAWRHMARLERLSEADLATWRSLYLAEVSYADYHLGNLVTWLRNTGRLDNTLVVVVADHGENLGDHGLLNHQYCVYDTLLRVPLVMHSPGSIPSGQRITHQVQTLDLFAAILEAANVEKPPSASESLLSDKKRPFVIAEYGVPNAPHPRNLERFGLREEQLSGFERGFKALRTDTHKLILGTDGSVELYAWQDDPLEMDDLSSRHPEVVRDLRGKLEKWQQEHRPRQEEASRGGWEIDPETEARLRALGYIE
ncbi:MAG: sulfatase [bacterium]